MIELYDWQKKAISAYKGHGTIEAVTGSGKSLVGKEIAHKLGGSTSMNSLKSELLKLS